MSAPASVDPNKPLPDWTAAYALVGVGIPVAWLASVIYAVVSDRRARARGADERVAATTSALRESYNRRYFPWREAVRNAAEPRAQGRRLFWGGGRSGGRGRGGDGAGSLSSASTSTGINNTDSGGLDLTGKSPKDQEGEELVQMRRAQQSWVPQPVRGSCPGGGGSGGDGDTREPERRGSGRRAGSSRAASRSGRQRCPSPHPSDSQNERYDETAKGEGGYESSGSSRYPTDPRHIKDGGSKIGGRRGGGGGIGRSPDSGRHRGIAGTASPSSALPEPGPGFRGARRN